MDALSAHLTEEGWLVEHSSLRGFDAIAADITGSSVLTLHADGEAPPRADESPPGRRTADTRAAATAAATTLVQMLRATTPPNTRREQRKHGGLWRDAEEPGQHGELGHRGRAAGAVDEVVFVLRPLGTREGAENGGGVLLVVGVEGGIRHSMYRREALVVLPFPPSCAR